VSHVLAASINIIIALTMEAAGISETSVKFYQNTKITSQSTGTFKLIAVRKL
jgi:hypothetical protein